MNISRPPGPKGRRRKPCPPSDRCRGRLRSARGCQPFAPKAIASSPPARARARPPRARPSVMPTPLRAASLRTTASVFGSRMWKAMALLRLDESHIASRRKEHKQEQSGGPPLHRLRAAAQRGDAGAADLDQAKRLHDGDELLDLRGAAGQLEDEVPGRRVDDLGLEGVGEPQRLDPLWPVPATLTSASSRSSGFSSLRPARAPSGRSPCARRPGGRAGS